MKPLLFLLLASVPLPAAEVHLAWNASETPGVTNYVLRASTNTLTASTLPEATVRLDLGTNLTATLADIAPGQWTFAATAMKDGVESGPSNILPVEVAHPPLRLRTVVLQYSGTLSNFQDVGFFKLRIP